MRVTVLGAALKMRRVRVSWLQILRVLKMLLRSVRTFDSSMATLCVLKSETALLSKSVLAVLNAPICESCRTMMCILSILETLMRN